jgi:3-hydroxyisobutyrate dehydrogenase-like beta-hydroxyacid dehydrogenase
MKLVTNLVLGLNRAALAEGLVFGKSLGLDGKQTLHALRSTMAYSRIMDTKGKKMLRNDFKPQARLSQHLKDVRLTLKTAKRAQQKLPLTETHRKLLQQAEAAGLGPLDNSAIIRVIGPIGPIGPIRFPR